MKILSELGCLLVITVLVGCWPHSDNIGALEEFADFECPAPGSPHSVPWAQGSAKICGIRHGSFIVANSGVIVLVGQYAEGQRVGVWYWYNSDGKVIESIDYSTQ